MDILIVSMRVIHIFTGIYWAGAGLLMAAAIGPTAQALKEDAGKFMNHLYAKSRYSPYITAAAILATLSGLILYWRLFGFTLALNSGSQIALTIGAIAGLLAFFHGAISLGRKSDRIKAIVIEMEASGGPPTPEQIQEIQTLQEGIGKGGTISSVLMVIAILGMSLSEYFAF
ncbi:MAG: hypothetical protein DWQ07_00880 [Chloroflexi bacterium]|nr:MAG: hypothetical protein DWQ07_00880 [Chloroflexota bacterium]MBL1196564.1 hypothetical protein [Chloroflexota bacterium]NOH13859.1 hypothetical protein [Chloroflexota bacterium]